MPLSPLLLRQAADMHRRRSEYAQAAELLRRSVQVDPMDSSSWAWLGYCSLMQDDADGSFVAYQQALYLPNPPSEEPYLWYGLGLLHEHHMSDEEAAQYFAQVHTHSSH